MKAILLGTLGSVLFALFLIGGGWAAMNVSYSLFYEDMVIQTIKEQVKHDSIK